MGVCHAQGWCMTWGMDHTVMYSTASWPGKGGHGAHSTPSLQVCSDTDD